jgi:zinc protease
MDQSLAAALEDGFTAEALARSRTGMLAAAVYARDNLFSSPRIFGDALTSGLTVEAVEAWPDEVRAVTMEQLMAAGRAVLDRRRSVTGLLLPEKGTGK